MRWIAGERADEAARKKWRAKVDAELDAHKAKTQAELAAAAAKRGSHKAADLRRPWGTPAEVWTTHMPEHIQEGGYTQLKMESMADALKRIKHKHRHRAYARSTSSSSSSSSEPSCSESLSESGSSSGSSSSAS